MIGRTIAHYRIIARIGQGGMGVVYRAQDERLERDVALKVLPPGLLTDERARRRFRKEALALSTLNHPNIQTVHDFDTQDGVDFLVTEYVEGVTLSDRVAVGALPAKEVSRLGVQLAEGLSAAHAQGIIHADLKPDNLRVTPEGRLKILDFGLARRALASSDGATTRSAESTYGLAGTLPYMAPEQLLGAPTDERTDLFAVGCVLYELSTGQRTFSGHNAPQLTDAILHQMPVPLRGVRSDVSPELERIVFKCLEKDPDQRYQSARELAVDLRRFEAGRAATPVRAGTSPVSRRRVAWAGGVAVVALIAIALVVDTDPWRVRSGAPIQALAVLPLANLMGDPEQEYFVAAMHEALIAELGQIAALTVISRTSVMRYRQTSKTVPEIARELNVDALVEGSMFRAGDSVRVQLQLIRASPVERQLWSRTYEGELESVMTMQKSVARAIAEQIEITVTPREAARLRVTRSVDPAAYDAWAKGRFQFTRLTVESLHECVKYAGTALAIDSMYAPAFALKAWCQSVLPNIGGGTPHEVYPSAAAAARRALVLDDSLADAHFALGWILASYDWNWPAAEEAFRRGLELNPSSAVGHSRFGWFLSWMARDAEAVAEMVRAQQLNPTGVYEVQGAAAVHFVARRYDDAIVTARRAIQIDPLFAWGHDRLGLAYTEKGMYAKAIASLERAVELSGNVNHRAALGRAHALAGRREDARRILEALLRISQQSYQGPVQIAVVYAALGEMDDAIRWLEEGYRTHDGNMVLLKVFPAWDPLRADPRFQDLLQRMRFP